MAITSKGFVSKVVIPPSTSAEPVVGRGDLQLLQAAAARAPRGQKRAAPLKIVRGLRESPVRLAYRSLELPLGLVQTPHAREHHPEVVVARRELTLRAPDGLAEVRGRTRHIALARRKHPQLVVRRRETIALGGARVSLLRLRTAPQLFERDPERIRSLRITPVARLDRADV